MIILAIILVWLAIALIYALQFQICRDYQVKDCFDIGKLLDGKPESEYHWVTCELKRYSIFDWRRIQ